ncbi:hypothetical protein A2533_03590 [Candidatus Falkowbacteria bacterium RIFOXYD2_FULL_35_9]|uniref:Nucleotidyl transferase domain-containing protein n=1 Tax=Candidatus Falkowbacteria bacterium RIFOXYC2_FULL_36_12 TaxID=1798002 RepID=A0A1F5T0G0_9BACT|nr:MAG: hypothetical protein A2300_02770 [Candidatus Falkowbacteria bacterium RIFOXYB2_FULL_35_7]OGF32402.1 MAG: hypothetical protein A2478_03725 [Candidatus Falkowbacteria bacterium RIFOXYC2_FULL_36_12]OGF34024.1 MAG: hypothetical protein A2223_03850 [Candidatus Falkowbacteria bacterium RIFOXYA2_FULL_35_8]OGF47391.1 MAG: hypothetical protein A2533_03590 [Candidatus Falkowbacteria bacterium RIFOXYD2_FULL_35_9]
MQALILASGTGSRLKPLTENLHKSLIKIGEKEILARLLETLISHKISDIIITTGHLASQIMDFTSKNFSTANIQFVHSDKYDCTNYIYSMWKAKKVIYNDLIILHSDLLFEPAIIEKLLNNEKSGVLIKNSLGYPKKDFKALIGDNRIKEISTKLDSGNLRFCLPVYKLLKKDWDLWITNIENYINQNKVTNYAEDALNEILHQVVLEPVYFHEELAMEIDDFEDYDLAQQLISD